MIKHFLSFVAMCAIVGAILVVAGCSQKKIIKGEEGTGATGQVPLGAAESLDAQPVESKSNFRIMEGRTTGPMLPIYFDYNMDAIRVDQQSRIETNALYLRANPDAVVTIEGNCDERGTNEYNLALGDRRALQVKEYLASMGVNGSNLSTLSYGEEKPLNLGHDELAWSQNRRVDFAQK